DLGGAGGGGGWGRGWAGSGGAGKGWCSQKPRVPGVARQHLGGRVLPAEMRHRVRACRLCENPLSMRGGTMVRVSFSRDAVRRMVIRGVSGVALACFAVASYAGDALAISG